MRLLLSHKVSNLVRMSSKVSCLRWISVSLLLCNTSIIKQTLLDISHNPSRSPPGIGKGEAIPIDPNGVRCDASEEKPNFGKERKKDNSMLPPAWRIMMVLLCFRVGLSLYVLHKGA